MKKLCKGFAQYDTKTADFLQEKLFAVTDDGTVLETPWSEFKNSFGAGRTWLKSSVPAAEVRERSEFIGNYDIPAVN